MFNILSNARRTLVMATPLALTACLVPGSLAVAPRDASPARPVPVAEAVSQPAPASFGAPGPALSGAYASTDALLTALESADKDLTSFAADIRYIKVFPEITGGETQERRGKLVFARRMLDDERPLDAEAVRPGQTVVRPAVVSRGFSIVFDTLIVDKTERAESKHFIFDGRWLIERNEKERQFFKRRLVPVGQMADPLKIGEGPFPIPIGQKKQDILASFDAAVVAPESSVDSGPARRVLADTVQLLLKPREGSSEARDFVEIRIWYRSADLIPRRALTLNVDGSSSDVWLINQQRNIPVDDALFSLEPPKEAGWAVDIRDDVRGEGVPDAAPGAVPPRARPASESPASTPK